MTDTKALRKLLAEWKVSIDGCPEIRTYGELADAAVDALPDLLDEVDHYRISDMVSSDPNKRGNRELQVRVAKLEATQDALVEVLRKGVQAVEYLADLTASHGMAYMPADTFLADARTALAKVGK